MMCFGAVRPASGRAVRRRESPIGGTLPTFETNDAFLNLFNRLCKAGTPELAHWPGKAAD